MRKPLTLLLVTAACALLAPAPANAGQELYKRWKVECFAKESPYTGATLVAAKVGYIMITRPHPKNNLRKMSIEVRLVPTTPGFRWNRSWRKFEISTVSADGANRRLMRSTTNYERADAGWNVEVRMTWRRRGKNDWEHKLEFPLDQTFCRDVG